MAKAKELNEVPLPRAAHLLGLGYWRCRDAVLRGELEGRQIGGRWVVSTASIEAFRRAQAAEPAGA